MNLTNEHTGAEADELDFMALQESKIAEEAERRLELLMFARLLTAKLNFTRREEYFQSTAEGKRHAD